jgi:hypothetical protein
MRNSLIVIVLLVVVAGGGFFAGMKYQQSKTPSQGDFETMRGQRGDQNSRMNPRLSGAQMVRGEIIDRDEESITVKLMDESSKIVLLTDNTQINKAVEGSKDDLEKGSQVMIFGQENSDGSVSASQIQLNAGLMMGPREEDRELD